MKKSFESTIDEGVRARYRLAENIGIVRKHKYIGMLTSPITFAIIYFLLDDLVTAGIAALLLLLHYLFFFEKNYRKSIRKMLIKLLKTDQPIPSEYEMDENGLSFRQSGQESRFSWANFKKINETPEALEIIWEPSGIAIIPKRIFSGQDEIQEWTDYIKAHTNLEPKI